MSNANTQKPLCERIEVGSPPIWMRQTEWSLIHRAAESLCGFVTPGRPANPDLANSMRAMSYLPPFVTKDEWAHLADAVERGFKGDQAQVDTDLAKEAARAGVALDRMLATADSMVDEAGHLQRISEKLLERYLPKSSAEPSPAATLAGATRIEPGKIQIVDGAITAGQINWSPLRDDTIRGITITGEEARKLSASLAAQHGDGKAKKFDDGKPSYSLLPSDALAELVKVYDLGAVKYGRENWAKGMDWHRVFDAMQRHSWAWWSGERNDPIDGQMHLASVAWCALTLIAFELRGVGNDDRPKD